MDAALVENFRVGDRSVHRVKYSSLLIISHLVFSFFRHLFRKFPVLRLSLCTPCCPVTTVFILYLP